MIQPARPLGFAAGCPTLEARQRGTLVGPGLADAEASKNISLGIVLGNNEDVNRIDMPAYRIHRLKDHLRQSFRFAPHVSGAASLKPRDYTPGRRVEAASPYAAYFELRGAQARSNSAICLK